MKQAPRRTFRVAASVAALVVIWGVVAVWLVPWLIAKAYAGEAGAFLNAQISGQDRTPLEAYLGLWRAVAVRLTAVLVAGIAFFVVARSFRRQIAAALRKALPGLPGARVKEVLALGLWTGVVAGVAEGIVWMFRTVVLDLPLGGVPWLRTMWSAPIAATVTFLVFGLLLLTLDRVLRMEGAMRDAAPALFVGFAVYGLLRSMTLGIAPLAAALLAAGSGAAFARVTASRPQGTRRFVRRTFPVLAAGIAIAAMVLPVRQRVLERSGLAGLPAVGRDMPSVLLVVWDAVRAPNLSLYGYERETAPELESFAARGVRFDRAISTTSWSLPSHGSLFTGHHAFELSTGWREPLDGQYPTLAGVLGEAGFATAAFVANRYYGRLGYGLERGFALYDDLASSSIAVIPNTWWVSSKIFQFIGRRLGDRRAVARRPASAINRSFLSWQARNTTRPFFAFLNYIGAHEPYRPPDPFNLSFSEKQPRYWFSHEGDAHEADHLRDLVDAYDGSIRYIDYEFGRLLDELDRRGILDDLIVIVTSDHGEEFEEHGAGLIGHGRSLYIQTLHVPLVIAAPGLVPSGIEVKESVSLRDVPATVLDLLHLDPRLAGESLVPIMTGSGPGPVEPPLAHLLYKEEYRSHPAWPASAGDAYSLLWNDLHYIVDGRGKEQLFDISVDPDETNDLAASPDAREPLQWFRDQLTEITGDSIRPPGSR